MSSVFREKEIQENNFYAISIQLTLIIVIIRIPYYLVCFEHTLITFEFNKLP